MNSPNEQEMLHRMAAYCSTAERCIRDVEQKIAASGLDKESGKRIIARLLQERFIDEIRYARFFVNDKFRFNKWGRIKIVYELQKKGIPSAIREEAIGQIDEAAYIDTLLSLLRNKKKTLKGEDTRKTRIKLFRFATGRGFESKETNNCLKQLLKGDEDDLFFD